MKTRVHIRSFNPGDEPILWRLFHDTIHEVCTRDYNAGQINAWAPAEYDSERWSRRIRELNPLIAEVGGRIAGYADVQADGYIDHFYCHYCFQGQGVGFALMRAIESRARTQGLAELSSEVSITAQPFFRNRGFEVLCEQQVTIGGVQLTNFQMRKDL